MPILKPVYAAQSNDFAGAGFSTLANGAVHASSAVDNSSARMQDYLIEIAAGGTIGANAFLDVRLAPSEDGTNFGTWDSAVPLGIIHLAATPQMAFFSVAGHGGLYQAPKYFKVMVKNFTGNALTSGTMKHQGVQIEAV